MLVSFVWDLALGVKLGAIVSVHLSSAARVGEEHVGLANKRRFVGFVVSLAALTGSDGWPQTVRRQRRRILVFEHDLLRGNRNRQWRRSVSDGPHRLVWQLQKLFGSAPAIRRVNTAQVRQG